MRVGNLSPEHREVAEFMLERARQNLGASRTLVATEGHAENIPGFHLQQATEKALESVLAAEKLKSLAPSWRPAGPRHRFGNRGAQSACFGRVVDAMGGGLTL